MDEPGGPATHPLASGTPPGATGRGAARFRAALAALVAIKLALHLAVLGRFAYHRDELYFIACARHLDTGYVDHPPMIAWITWLFGAPFGYDLHALRLAPVLAGAATIALSCLLVRELGGGVRATRLAGACLLAAPVFLRTGSLLCIPAFEPPIWTAAALVSVRMARADSTQHRARSWIWLGAIAGLGLLTKHSIGMWLVGLTAGLMTTPARSDLRTRWPWIGAAIAVALFSPNIAWQITHDFATVEFLRELSRSVLSEVPRALFLAGIVVYLNPITMPVWITGAISVTGHDRVARPIGVAFVFTLAVLLLTRAKPYYIAGAFPALFAAGAVAIERRLAARSSSSPPSTAGSKLVPTAIAVVLVSAVPFALISMPIVPVDRLDRALTPFVAWATPPRNLTGELHDQFGWPEQADAIARASRRLDEDERRRAVVLASSYGRAAAVEVLQRDRIDAGEVPPVVSGHMNYWFWGVPEGRGDVAIAIGFTEVELRELYAEVEEADPPDDAPLAWPSERRVSVRIARHPIEPLRDAWPRLRHYDHRLGVALDDP